MGQGHRKITFKINGQEVMSNEGNREDREDKNKNGTENAQAPREEKKPEQKMSEQKETKQKDTGAKPSGGDSGGGIKGNYTIGREQSEVVDLSEKRREWAERDRQPLTESPGLPLHRKKKKSEVARSKKGGSFKHLKMPITIAGALMVGLMFGLPLLQLATNFSLTSDAGTTGSTSGDQPGSIAVDEEEETEEMHVDIVQAGAFSTNEAGHEMQEVFSEAGFPAILHEDEDEEMIYLYVGMTAEGEAEDEMIPEINDEGLEGYVKALSIPIPTEEMDEETEQLASGVGEALLAGLGATSPSGDREEAEHALAAIDMDSLEGDGQGDERFSETIQALHEEANVEEHEAWMEATLAYENWVRSL
ncbi:hypothetical protein HUG20_14260 [Salicibibacter cibi]|uniref:SPOR domain-containing protein n=1 Tax=Salicibibacter cibi TaxID=2743001 RepID=A0A7T6ZCE6_9BACI|nr:hypothetical protein [Salicibibacter cibi]QQK80940.1 hypothetical protein HUG20_14260 [Salicibibacter cibi]